MDVCPQRRRLANPRVVLWRFLAILMVMMTGGMPRGQEPTEDPGISSIATTTTLTAIAPAEAEQSFLNDLQAQIDSVFGKLVNDYIAKVIFYQVPVPFYKTGFEASDNVAPTELRGPVEQPKKIPLILLILVFGGIFFTLWNKFVNIRLFRHAFDVVMGKYDHPDHAGEISHFKALTSALSATVGLGNIAGVAVAITVGGPGAVFWLWVTAVFGMSMKFTDCTMAQYYRRVKKDGSILGGPMVYLEEGIRDIYPGLAPLGRFFGILFAFCCIMASFGGGNLFQANQANSVIAEQWKAVTQSAEAPALLPWFMGAFMMIMAGLVIIGGIKRIGKVTASMVPLMCGIYCIVCLIIIIHNIDKVPHMFADIFTSAFKGEALYGGFLGVMIQGMKRASFSNEAGLGSSAIAHAAAKTDEPVREGVVAMLEPFIDTICVCTMTALAILITEAHLGQPGIGGVRITLSAFSDVDEIMPYNATIAPYLLILAVFVFAFSTIISWSYYGERATEYLFGEVGILPYRILYCLIILFGPLISLSAVVDFADMMLFSMAFPNIIGLLFLSGKLKEKVNDYVHRLKSGEMKMYKAPADK